MSTFHPASHATWTGTRAPRLYQRSLWLERPALQAAVSLAGATPADRLLDVGTGTGALLAMLASSPNRPGRAVGVDRSRSMLTAAPPLPKGWAIVEGDASALPYSDHSFDAVTICYLLHLLEPEGRLCVLREARRVAHPRARVVIVTVDARSPALRTFLKVVPRWTGLRRIDLASDLLAARLRAVRSHQVRGGWPSSCWLAEPAG